MARHVGGARSLPVELPPGPYEPIDATDDWHVPSDEWRVSIGSMPGASSREMLLGASLYAGVLDGLAGFDAGSCEALRERDPGLRSVG